LEEKEELYSDRLIKKAQHLRVPVPPRPKWNDEHGDLEATDDWEVGNWGMWLTVSGITKVREEIRKEQKWRREGRANWAVLLSAIGGVIGVITGLVAVLTK
jgi:hypothetical protein